MSKFVLNMNVVNEQAEQVTARNSGGKNYFSRKNIPDNGSIDMRVMPPLPTLNGLYYLERTQIWINSKPYMSPKTVGEECPILALVEEIKASGDPELMNLLKAKSFNIATDYLIPILLLDCTYSAGKLQSYEVVDDCVKIADFTWGTISAINSILVDREYQNGSQLGIFDPELGFNLIATKTVKGAGSEKRTSYGCKPSRNPQSIEAEYYDKIPDLLDYAKGRVYSDEYLYGVAMNYFHGDAMPSEEGKMRVQEAAPKTATKAAKKGSALLDLLKNSSGK